MILKEAMLNFINVSAIRVFQKKVAAIPSGSHVAICGMTDLNSEIS